MTRKQAKARIEEFARVCGEWPAWMRLKIWQQDKLAAIYIRGFKDGAERAAPLSNPHEAKR